MAFESVHGVASQDGKLQHWRASQAENAPKAAPVLEFSHLVARFRKRTRIHGLRNAATVSSQTDVGKKRNLRNHLQLSNIAKCAPAHIRAAAGRPTMASLDNPHGDHENDRQESANQRFGT